VFRLPILPLPLLCTILASAQNVAVAPRKVPVNRPGCAAGAICFAGQVSEGEEFRKALNAELEFVLRPGWTITVVPKHPEGDCNEFASVVNPPYRAHRDLYIDMTYGWTAEEEVSNSPREFSFVTNCADYGVEWARLNLVLWPYTGTEKQVEEALAKLGTSPSGQGRFWITQSKTSHSAGTADDTGNEELGKIEWMKFSVEIKLPR
jgi:hypothetical protein